MLEALAGGSQLLFGRMRGDRDRILTGSAVRHLIAGFLDVAGLHFEWEFSSHQFRKTFARFVALSGSTAALALMRHFKHVSIQMTERYFPNDPELINEIIEASEELIAETLSRVFGSERLGGMRGREIVSRNQAYRGEKHAAELAELVKNDDAMTLRFTSFFTSMASVCTTAILRSAAETFRKWGLRPASAA